MGNILGFKRRRRAIAPEERTRQTLRDKIRRLESIASPDQLIDIEESVDFRLSMCEEAGGAVAEQQLEQIETMAVAAARSNGGLMGRQRDTALSAWRDPRPTPGWKGRTDLVNPRTPAVPATLRLTLEQYFAAAALVGLISAQNGEPDIAWAAKWAAEMGQKMAAETLKRRPK